MAITKQFTVKDATRVREDFLRTMRNGLRARGVANPNVSPGSDWYILGTAIGNEIAVVGANNVLSGDEMMPDTTSEAGILRLEALLEIITPQAAGSVGSVVLVATATTLIATGQGLTDDAGLRYEVTVGGSYTPDQLVPIRAVDVGETTNREAGEILRWGTAPAFAEERAPVSLGGLVNGADAPTLEDRRRTIFRRMRYPANSGNWAHAIQFAEEASGSVQAAVAYPAIYGPSSASVAVMAAPTATNKSRVVAAPIMTGTVVPYVQGQMPGNPFIDVTTVADKDVDVAFGLSLPEATTASPPGLGGGWKDGTPWPAVNGTTTFRCAVTAVTSSTVFTVDATTAPQPGVSHIAWISPYDRKVYQAVVNSVTGSTGAYVITLSTPFVGIAVGSFISPDCERFADYAQAIFDLFASFGPGEKSANVSALARGFRHPPPTVDLPYGLGPTAVRRMQDAGTEVADAQFLYRWHGAGLGESLTGTGGALNPPVPVSALSSPFIFVPRHVALMRIPS